MKSMLFLGRKVGFFEVYGVTAQRNVLLLQNLLPNPSFKERFTYYICSKALNCRFTVNCEQANMRKKEVVAHFKVIYQDLLGGVGKHENSRPGQLASEIRIGL
jgi:hypothetical protein